jgi:hypothetical protein
MHYLKLEKCQFIIFIIIDNVCHYLSHKRLSILIPDCIAKIITLDEFLTQFRTKESSKKHKNGVGIAKGRIYAQRA